MSDQSFSIAIIGGGIVGLSTALHLQQKLADERIVVLEAEPGVGRHQTGHNSGVLHSGIYYKPGSAKAELCRRGKSLIEDFCDEHRIPWDRCGKVIVATTAAELSGLDLIAERGAANGVAFERIHTDQLREIEPAAVGLAALHVPATGIVNFGQVCRVMADVFTRHGGAVLKSFAVHSIQSHGNSLTIGARDGRTVRCAKMVACAGLNSDRVCRLAGGKPSCKIVPFRGEYYELTEASAGLCNHLIYPVPDPSFPFLGVHFTRMIDGGVECGPNAVLALSRQGYSWSNVSLTDLAETMRYGGFRKLAIKHWRKGIGEMQRSLSKRAFVTALQKMVPSIRESDLIPGRAGVRAQAVTEDGGLVDDFLWEETENAIHVLNAPSPAATASMAIAEQISARVTGIG
tara:strand:- start:64814 stop:66019 length:1206 start_codon:yes stop_codon:yes gene_type:complete